MSAALVPTNRGARVHAAAHGRKWLTRQTRRDEWGSRSSDGVDDGVPKEEWPRRPTTTRGAPWVQGGRWSAAGTKRSHVTEPYRFFTNQAGRGFTAAAAFRSGDRDRVLGFDACRARGHLRVHDGTSDSSTSDGLRGRREPARRRLPNQMSERTPEARREALLRPVGSSASPCSPTRSRSCPSGRLRERGSESGRAPPGGAGVAPTAPTSRSRSRSPRADHPRQASTELRIWLIALIRRRPPLRALARGIARAAVRAAHRGARRGERPSERGDSSRERRSRARSGAAPARGMRTSGCRESLKKLVHARGRCSASRARIQQETFRAGSRSSEGSTGAGSRCPRPRRAATRTDAVGIARDGALRARPRARRSSSSRTRPATAFGPALSVTQVRAMLRMAVRAGQGLAEIVLHLNEQLTTTSSRDGS